MEPLFNIDPIPLLLQQHLRWLLWGRDGEGKKTPRNAMRADRNCNANSASNWASFAVAALAATKNSTGIGFALGPVQNGPRFAGIDLDKCRNPETGAIEPWAMRIVEYFDTYTEVSPSGTGLHLFFVGSLPDDARQGKVYKVELYDRDRYFTVTGNHLPGTPTTVEEREPQLRDLHAKLRSGDVVTVCRVFGYVIAEHSADEVWIRCPWADHHTPPDKDGDCGLHRSNGEVDGFHCFHAGCADKTLGDLRKLFGLNSNGDFITAPNGQILKGEPDNIRRALAKLSIEVSYDRFGEKVFVTQHGHTRLLTEALHDRAWFAINETFGFLPPSDLFYRVVTDHAHNKSFHPVLDYLSRLQWDGTPRLDTWLVRYGGADDTPYVRAVGRLPLLAAVRRVREPGCKFDELLVLESKQGTHKSTAIATLCPNPDWFSDDLALGLDSQEVIERTGGKWLIEAAELKGIRHADVERLKNFLSRSVDGPARRAYGRISEERPRQFVFIGTTNSKTYLPDSTGNRRFWPVRVRVFDVVNLRRDRDQLWAEAAQREHAGESIRLDPSLWGDAAAEQDARRQEDPWEEPLLEAIADTEKVPVRLIWDVLGVPPFNASQSVNAHALRVAEIMERNGFVKGGVQRIEGKPTRCWLRANSPLLKDADEDASTARRPAFIKRVSEG